MHLNNNILIFFSISLLFKCIFTSENIRNFYIDYDANQFVKDSRPFSYVSGSIHYTRVLSSHWRDRLLKMKAAGLDAIETSVMWNMHQPTSISFSFEDNLDLVRFIELADELNLLVILRVGPYVGCEVDLGGLPSWLLVEGTQLRSTEPLFLFYVQRWFAVLFEKIIPLLYSNGGPIIMLQLEHEYGSFGRELYYMSNMTSFVTEFLAGNEVVIFTADKPRFSALERGSVPGFLTTVTCSTKCDVNSTLAKLREFGSKGPLVVSELRTGNIEIWGRKQCQMSCIALIENLDAALDLGASVNLYMFEGGTNFGFENGAIGRNKYVMTNFESGAPLNEAGDPTPKYYSLRNFLSVRRKRDLLPVPPASVKSKYGVITVNFYGSILQSEYLDMLATRLVYSMPLSMEHFYQSSGYILYRVRVLSPCNDSEKMYLYMKHLSDRGIVFVNNKPQGVLDSNVLIKSLLLWKNCTEPVQIIDIFVENMGRFSHGRAMNGERKGISGSIWINGDIVSSVEMYSIPLSSLDPASLILFSYDGYEQSPYRQLCFYQGYLHLKQELNRTDTYLYINPLFSKGQAFINGFNLGRYWPDKGPSLSLYVPGSLLKPYPERNVVTLFEIEYCSSPESTFVGFMNSPWP